MLRFAMIVGLVALMGCAGPRLERMALDIEQTAGVPVFVEAAESDECLKGQLRQLGDELAGLSPEARGRLADTLQARYSRIVLAPSEVTRTLTGTRMELSWYRSPDDRLQHMEKKLIANDVTVQGEARATVTKSGGVLTLRVAKSSDQVHYIVLGTRDEGIYSTVSDRSDLIRWSPALRIRTHHLGRGESCGEFATLDQVLAAAADTSGGGRLSPTEAL